MTPSWFVGLPMHLDRSVQTALRDAPACVRVLHPDDVHLTVAFFGGVDEAAARRAFAEAHRFPRGALDGTLGPIEALGNPRRPSALAATIDVGRAPLVSAITATRDAFCDAAGVERETRPVLPHVTLARVRRKARHDEHRAAVAWARGVDLSGLSFRADRLALFTWREGPGPRYQHVLVEPLT